MVSVVASQFCPCSVKAVTESEIVSLPAVSDSLRPMDHNPPGSSVHGTLQIRILEWVAMPSSKGRPQGLNPDLLHCRQIFYCLSHQGSRKAVTDNMEIGSQQDLANRPYFAICGLGQQWKFYSHFNYWHRRGLEAHLKQEYVKALWLWGDSEKHSF